jgi:hypothetical protein
MTIPPGQRLYADLTWPIISPLEDYVAKALEFASLIKGHTRREAKTCSIWGAAVGTSTRLASPDP